MSNVLHDSFCTALFVADCTDYYMDQPPILMPAIFHNWSYVDVITSQHYLKSFEYDGRAPG